MKTIILISQPPLWDQAQHKGIYTQSTITSTLEEVGFIHSTFADQTMEVLPRFKDKDEVILLLVDADKVTAPIKYEAALSGRAGTFPHIHGPLNTDAVYKVVALEKNEGGEFIEPEELRLAQMSSKRVILFHGLNASPNDKWYPWFAKEMKQLGVECFVPVLPNPTDPNISGWTAELDKLDPDANTILVGHSRGGVAVLRWLEAQPESLRVKKVILIATNSGLLHKRVIKGESNRGFYTEQGYNFDKIKQHCGDFVVFHSKDDQWVPYEAGIENAEGLGARLLTFDDRKHFGRGIDEIPELVKEIV